MGTICVFKDHNLQTFCLKYMSKFNQLEVVGRGSETQLQVGENLADEGLRLVTCISAYCIFMTTISRF